MEEVRVKDIKTDSVSITKTNKLSASDKVSWSNDYRRLNNSIGKKGTGGRNNMGRITAYHRGGGNKRRYRFIDNLNTNIPTHINKTGYSGKTIEITGIVKSIERDPNRTALIALVYWSNTVKNLDLTSSSDLWSDYSYILAPAGLKLGDTIKSIRSPLIQDRVDSESNFTENLKGASGASLIAQRDSSNLIPTVGNLYLLKDLAVGTIVHNVAGKYIRAAGCSGIIISKTELSNGTQEVIISLQSGQYKAFVGNTIASIGSLSNPEHKAYKYRKAGQKAWLGRRPIVRGVAMNPIDHPHGGGEGKSSGGRPSVTPWGKPTKGKPTRSKAKPRLLKASRPI